MKSINCKCSADVSIKQPGILLGLPLEIQILKMNRFEKEGTLDRLSELVTHHSATLMEDDDLEDLDDDAEEDLLDDEIPEISEIDKEALDRASDNLMHHLTIDHLDMLHHRFMTGN